MLMIEAVSSSQINDLLIRIGRSLLQYVSESWPWAASGSEETRRTLLRLAAQQRENVAELAWLLDARGEIVDFGSYPTEYTSLHYVSVDYLLDRLVANQSEIASACEKISRAAEGDADAAELLRDITAAERQFLDELRRLAQRT
jgi:hypothetical protein